MSTARRHAAARSCLWRAAVSFGGMNQPRLAALFITCAGAFIAGTTLLAKALGSDALGPPLSPLQVSHARFLFAWLVIAASLAALRPSLTHPHLKLHLARTICGWGGVSLMFAAAARIPLADATALSFLNPVFAMVLAIPLLGEKVGPVRWVAAAIALTGALILLRPTPESFQMASLFALGAALALGLELIFIKRLTGQESPLQILFINNSLGLVISSLAVLAVWQPPTPGQWMALAGVGVLMATAQTLFIQGMRRADASFVAPFSYSTLVFAGLYDIAVFNNWPDAISLLGAAVIVGGALLLVLRENRAARAGKTVTASAGSLPGTTASTDPRSKPQ